MTGGYVPALFKELGARHIALHPVAAPAAGNAVANRVVSRIDPIDPVVSIDAIRVSLVSDLSRTDSSAVETWLAEKMYEFLG